MEKLWTTAEVAQYLGLEEPDVEQLVRQGKLTGYKLGGQFLRFRPDQVEALKREIRGGALQVGPTVGGTASAPTESWWPRMRDALYFYDFYLASAALLLIVVLYLLISTG